MRNHRVWSDENHFVIDLKFDGRSVVYVFPIQELSKGASLSRMMNLKVRQTVKSHDGIISVSALKQAAREGLDQLREASEEYFTDKGIGNDFD